jgi:hypothetical protein
MLLIYLYLSFVVSLKIINLKKIFSGYKSLNVRLIYLFNKNHAINIKNEYNKYLLIIEVILVYKVIN